MAVINEIKSYHILLLFLATLTIVCAGQLTVSSPFFTATLSGGGEPPPAETNVTSRPIADLDNTGVWTTAPLWSDLNGVVGSGDGAVVSADGTPTAAEPFTVDGSTTKDPETSTGHILRFRAAKTASAGANYDIVVELRQGYTSEAAQGTLISSAGRTNISDTTLTTVTTTLTASEADSITDYANLQFRMFAVKNGGGANRNCQIADVEFEVEAP